ncbi:hypothetical protein NONO_c00880 [Nocardia nova SH22a]|uniref:DUF4328 domain-containing protein n=1 Tax=Nocardia nova SH22a TaxID=1415166 RepID=W5T7J6_9NOCA|nr:DUF4328 domain-containing protein [Nocardia nova]AHH14908.1 hypothetical protein NONO_c00880 [Nocardia nova SH22a]
MSSTVVQPCARCGARWAVHGAPMHWCPRCRGVLLSPAPVDAPPERRNYRWVARPPGRGPRPERRRSGGAIEPPTPHYTEIPRWGLHDVPRPERDVEHTRAQRALRWATERVAGLMLAAIILFALAAVSELGRYLILLRNRTRLIEPVVLFLSDLTVYATALAALICALVAAVGLLGWLARARADAYAANGHRDPRSLRALLCGGLIPVVNLVWPGVFLTELVRQQGGDPRTLRAVRIWWSLWVLNGVMVIAALFWRLADTLQARANGVIFTVYTDLVAVAVAVSALWVLRMCEGRDLRGRIRMPKRWLPAPGPAVQVIEPVHPVADKEEVMAK